MAGNKAIYDRAMEQNREAAQQHRWGDALKHAQRALHEFSNENDARTAYAVALFHLQRYDQALQVLQYLHGRDPKNPFFLEYLARTYEGQKQIDEAVETYRALVAIHQNQRDAGKMIRVLRDILRLRPELDDQRERLAQLLRETGARADAAGEYLYLAQRSIEQRALDTAAERAELALQLDPQSRAAKELIGTIHQAMEQAADSAMPMPAAGGAAAPQGEGLPSHRAMSGALRSQEFVLDRIIKQAQQLQEAGDTDGAIEQYEQAINAGLTRADVLYSVGLLYQERGDHSEAVKVLTQAAADSDYALSAHFALGASYAELKQFPQAAQEYEQAISLVDLQTVGRTEAEDLVQMYESVTQIYERIGNLARAASLYSTLANFFQSKRWGKERAAEFSKRAKELQDRNMLAKLSSIGTGALVPTSPQELTPKALPTSDDVMPETWGKIRPITEFLRTGGLAPMHEQPEPSSLDISDPLDMFEQLPEKTDTTPITPLDTTGLDEQTERLVTLSGKYAEQGLLDAALDACYEVMALNVDYLPIHLRLGEIYERQQFLNEAQTKYQNLIDVLAVFGQSNQAIDVYYRLIDISEQLGTQLTIVNARARLAELLRDANRLDDAAEQVIHIANHYFRIGQTNRALEEFRRGIHWAPKNANLRSNYGITLFKLGRYEAALEEFRKALEGNADDPVIISRINMTLALLKEHPNAVWDSLATLLDLIKGNTYLSDLVQTEYRTALLEADEPILHYLLAIIQQSSNQHSSALLELEQALSLFDGTTNDMLPLVLVHQAMANSYIALGQANEALEQLRYAHQAITQNPITVTVKHHFARPLSPGELVKRMAEAHAASDDLVAAEQALRQALKEFPYDRNIYTKLADVCFRQGKLKEALRSLEDLATHYEQHQHLDQAIEILEDATKLAPNNISVSNRLAHLYIRRGYPEKGVESLIRVAELQRKDGQLKEAVSNLQQAAEIQNLLGRQQETLEIYDRIVSIAPDDIEARQWLSIMYTLAFRTADAIQEKKEIARIYAQQRDYDNAIAELHQIIGLNQNDLDAYYMLGDMLMRRNEYGQAVQLYKRMLRRDDIEVERVEALLAAATRMFEQQSQ